MSLENAIKYAQKIIINNDRTKIINKKNIYKGYQTVYFVTNENIDGYLQLVDFKNKNSALTVLSSGDHAFSLASKGINDIDTFDINKLQEYIALGLKRAMIQKYNYEEFLINIDELVHSSSVENISSIINDLLPYMEKEYQIFWRSIVDYYFIQKNNIVDQNLIFLLSRGESNTTILSDSVSYLKNEEEYNKLRNVIGKINITFSNIDVMNLNNFFSSNKYDLILLSNILDYVWFEDDNCLIKFIKSLDILLKKDGITFLNYIFLFREFEALEFGQEDIQIFKPFYNLSISQIYKQNLKIENLVDKNNLHKSLIIFKRMKK